MEGWPAPFTQPASMSSPSRKPAGPELPDRSHLEFAAAEGRVIYTANVGDFAALDAEYAETGVFHAGIIVTTNQLLGVGEQLRQVRAISDRSTHEDMRGRLEWIGRIALDP
jgi:hypothetical protein